MVEGPRDPAAVTQHPLFCRNQDAPRTYTQVMLCFPIHGNPLFAMKILQSAVAFLRANYPLFSARLGPDLGAGPSRAGRLYLSTSPRYALPFFSNYHPDKSYERLRSTGFAAADLTGLFSHSAKEVEALVKSCTEKPEPDDKPGQLFPVALVHGVALDKGLLIRSLVHHALFDGHMRSHFIDCLAAATRGETLLKSPTQTSFPFHYDHDQSFEKRLSACPELVLLPRPMPSPRASNTFHGGYPHELIPKTSKVFVLSEAKNTDKAPLLSTYICIAALTFAHAVRARLRGEGFQYLPQPAHPPTAILRHEVDFRRRAFAPQHLAETYFGNATVSVFTRVAQSGLLAAAGSAGRLGGVAFPLEDQADPDGSWKAAHLAALVREIKRSLDEVDEAYVRARLAVAETVGDPRRLGLDYDPRQPQVLGFNSWRYTGGSEAWGFPSSRSSSSSSGSTGEQGQGQRPEAFRVARGYSMHNALILPQRHGSRDQEILVSLSQVAMGELLEDAGWMKWVSETRD
ncbi:uncharacterized protein PG986_011537 [Apiospora aurea]|uniref:Uncharacterized protein n=1 Tax=Apiospora aurea TaxID=335848 RepID=A0ABR1PXE5_9PEZI